MPMRFLTSDTERAGRACPGPDPGDAGPYHVWWRSRGSRDARHFHLYESERVSNAKSRAKNGLRAAYRLINRR